MNRVIILVVHNVRSTHNVGALLRTAEGFGAAKVYLTGYTPYPKAPDDARLPHLAEKLHRQISKTALGAEDYLSWERHDDVLAVMAGLHQEGFEVITLEQTPDSVNLPDYKPKGKVAIIVGREVEGIEADVLAHADTVVEIPMLGKKESFNVSAAAAIALYHCRFA